MLPTHISFFFPGKTLERVHWNILLYMLCSCNFFVVFSFYLSCIFCVRQASSVFFTDAVKEAIPKMFIIELHHRERFNHEGCSMRSWSFVSWENIGLVLVYCRYIQVVILLKKENLIKKYINSPIKPSINVLKLNPHQQQRIKEHFLRLQTIEEKRKRWIRCTNILTAPTLINNESVISSDFNFGLRSSKQYSN